MSTDELAEVEALLTRLMSDPRGFLDRVLEQVAGRLAVDGGMPGPRAAGPTVVRGYDLQAHQVLIDRNVLLAAALGACECWGERADCTLCAGEGTSGWLPPDDALWDEYVTPALRRSGTEARCAPSPDGSAEPYSSTQTRGTADPGGATTDEGALR